MRSIHLPVKKLTEDAKIPTRAHATDAGFDLYSIEHVEIKPGRITTVSTGIAMGIPEGHVGLIFDRSSVAKTGMKVAGGVIDSGYTGELIVVFHNNLDIHGCFRKGEKVAQLIIMPFLAPDVVFEVEELAPSARGDKGFGSSGK